MERKEEENLISCWLKLWAYFYHLSAALRAVVWLIAFLFIGFWALCFTVQGQDVIRAMSDDGNFWQNLWYIVFIGFWSFHTLLTTRLLLYLENISVFEYPVEGPKKNEDYYQKNCSRSLELLNFMMGIFPILIGIWSYLFKPPFFPIISLTLMAIFYIYFYRFYDFGLGESKNGKKKLGYEKGRFFKFYEESKKKFQFFSIRGLLIYITTLFIITLSLFIFFPFVGILFGGSAVIALALAVWTTIVGVVNYLNYARQIPAFIGLSIWLGIVTYSSNIHEIRIISNDIIEKNIQSKNVTETFNEWIKTKNINRKDSTLEFPVYVVASQGGASKSGYWTAAVLSKLQDSLSEKYKINFYEHIFALSTVSGGSIGATYFTSLTFNHSLKPEKYLFLDSTSKFFGNDFFSPTLARFLFTDITRLFLPIHSENWDRQVALEQAWETIQPTWGKPFSVMNEERRKNKIPYLFLNCTYVEEGRRAIMSNIDINPNEFSFAEDLKYTIGKPVRISTAAGLSARFPLYSPAAKVPNKPINIVDGGYYENSGMLTASEILTSIHKYIKDAKKDSLLKKKVKLYLIVINFGSRTKDTIISENKVLPEINNIVSAGTSAIFFHANQYTQDLKIKLMKDSVVSDTITFHMARNSDEVAMNWYLSKYSQKNILSALKEKDNANAFETVIKQFNNFIKLK